MEMSNCLEQQEMSYQIIILGKIIKFGCFYFNINKTYYPPHPQLAE